MLTTEPNAAPPPGVPTRWRLPKFGWPDLLVPLAIAPVVIVVCMWIRTQGIQSLATWDGAMGSLGLLTGLLATVLMLLAVFLMARIPAVERTWGHDELARQHRLLGLWSFWLMVAHIVTLAIQRAGRDPADVVGAMWALFVTNPWMLMATVGTVLLVLVVITSIKAARKRLRYENWHLVHLYAYLGMIFALPHMLADGQHFHGELAQAYLWGLYIAAAAATIVYRVALPIYRTVSHRLTVSHVVTEAPGVVSIWMEGQALGRLKARSGQFAILRFLGGPEGWRANPYSLSMAPTDDRMRVTIEDLGDGSARAATLQPGTRVAIGGPYGTMTAERRSHPRMLMIAAGVGITPMRAMLEDAPYAPGEATLLFRVRDAAHVIHRAELDAIARQRGVNVHYLIGPRREASSWFPAGTPGSDDLATLRLLVPDVADRDVFLCGPPHWMHSVRSTLHAAGVPNTSIHAEDYDW